MPKYRVLETSLIGNEIHEAGAEVEYDGYPSGNLEPLDDEGKAKAEELVEINRQRVREMREANPFSPTIDAEAMGVAIAKAVGDAMGQLQADQAAHNAQLIEALTKAASSDKPSKG